MASASATATGEVTPAQESSLLLTSCRDVTSEPERAYPPMSSVPRTPDDRLLAPPTTEKSILYLAYGSNLCAETFLGVRAIRPLSRVPVSAPTLDLTFDLAGLPYLEPCFANSAPRKLPKLPIPPNPPKVPPFDPPTAAAEQEDEEDSDSTRGGAETYGPKWTKGLIGVVYEVTPTDYATILATEGGGSSYADILVPCFALPPRIAVPEKPPIDLPKPFFAHTLFAPSIPGALPPNLPGHDNPHPPDGGDDDGKPRPELPPKKWYSRFLLPPRREPPGYAQASERYLNLIRSGAEENELPEDYQAYLAALRPYEKTTCRQRIGGLFFMVPFGIIWLLTRLISRGKGPKKPEGDGKMHPWLAVLVVIGFNVAWMTYDVVMKPIFGDGEHTEEKEEGRKRGKTKRGWCGRRCTDEEKRGLLSSDDEDEE